MAAILDTQNQFYRILIRYIADPTLVPALAMDEAEAAYEFFKANLGWRKNVREKNELPILTKQAESLQTVISSMVHDNDPSPLSHWISGLPATYFARDPAFVVAQAILPETLLDDEMSSNERLQLLIIHWATYQIRVWTKRLKE
jgi:hypothetical protein